MDEVTRESLNLDLETVSPDQVKYFVEHGADMNAKNKDGDMPEHMAWMCGYKEVFKCFVEYSADKHAHAKDKEGSALTIPSTSAEKMQGDLSALSLKTTLSNAEEKGEPFSALSKEPSYALSEEYTCGKDVSISISNAALTKNTGR